MRTLLNKLFFGALYIFLSWKGLDGLILNALHQNTTTIDIRALELSEDFTARNVEVMYGVAGDDYLYYSEDYNAPVDLVYPLISHEQQEKLTKKEPIVIKAFVMLNGQDRDCLFHGKCIPVDSSSVKGIVKTGFENMKGSDLKSIESELIKVDEAPILIEPGVILIEWYWNLLMFLAGTTFGFTVIKSFFRKANSLSDYWNKVTEKAAR